MTNHASEGDFDSILDDDSLENATEDLDALDVLSNREVSQDDDDGDAAESEESKIKMLIAKGKEQGYLTYEQLTETLPERLDPDVVEHSRLAVGQRCRLPRQ